MSQLPARPSLRPASAAILKATDPQATALAAHLTAWDVPLTTRPLHNPELRPQLLITLYYPRTALDATWPRLLSQLAPETVWLQLGPHALPHARRLHLGATETGVSLIHAPLTWATSRSVLYLPARARQVLAVHARRATGYRGSTDSVDALRDRTLAALLELPPAPSPLIASRPVRSSDA